MFITIRKGLEGKKYREFIKWACARSDEFSCAYLYDTEKKIEYELIDRTAERIAFNRNLDKYREMLKPYLIKDINNIGDYPDAYERETEVVLTREKFPEAFSNATSEVNKCSPLKKHYEWIGGSFSISTIPELGGEEPSMMFFQTYKMDSFICEMLLKVDSMNEWFYPNHPEDPCFSRNGVRWFFSESHEQEYYIENAGNEERQFLDELGIEYTAV